MPETVRFDHYEVLTRDDGSLFELGRGAMGVTYKALDTNLRIPVALKVIASAHLNSEIARQRFVREARSAARLRNPHVATVYHLGTEGQTYFYAMEFIDGETVDALIKRNGPLPPKLALAIIDQVAKALQAAEPHGLVHRDIKPANLMVIRDGDALAVKVIDFGLAKSSLPGDDSATVSMGGFVGTPHFASPEQLEERDLDVRSDIYSVGVTLWFMLAGKTPFGGSMAQVMSQHLSKAPPFEKLNVPPSMARLLRRMLEKNPTNRPQNSTELRRDISQCLAELASPDASIAPLEPLVTIDEEQSYVTIADPSLLEGQEVKFEPGALVAGRYRILNSIGDTNLGQVFHAQDQTRAEDVRIIVLHASLALNGELLAALERTVEKLGGRPHANVIRIDALETIGGTSFLVLEWSEGASLVEVLRMRRELDATEVIALMGSIAAGVDHALASGIEQIDPGLHHIHVTFPQKPPEDWMKLPVSEWPPNAVKVNPLSFRAAAAAAGTWASAQTVIEGPVAGSGSATARGIRSVASIVYELLGGKLSHAALSGAAFEFKPLATLGEAGNDILRRAFSPDPPFSAAKSFANALADPANADLPRHSQATVGPGRTSASTTATSPVARPEISVEPPQPARSKWPIVLMAVVAFAVVGGAGAYFGLKRSGSTFSNANPTPPQGTIEPTPDVTPNGTQDTPDKPPPTPDTPPAPTRKEMLSKAVAEAKAFEEKLAWPDAVAAYVKIARDFPESEAGKTYLEAVCGTLRARPNGFSPDVFATIRAPMTDAAQLGVVSAMMVLAENLRKPAPGESFRWFDRAGELGDLEGMTQAGLMMASGLGVERNIERAVEIFKTAAAKGHPSAQAAYGECLLLGKGVEKDEKAAVSVLQQGVDGGNTKAMSLLSSCYEKGKGGLTVDLKEAARLLDLAVQGGDGRAMAGLGSFYILGKGVPVDKKRAFGLFQQGANKGDSVAMGLLAYCYEEGIGTSKNLQFARDWYKNAAEAGDANGIEWCKKNKVEFTPRESTLN
jgi:serine/threonine protein kinase/TPR repeat protein